MKKYRILKSTTLVGSGFMSPSYAIQSLKINFFNRQWINETPFIFQSVAQAERFLSYLLDGYEYGENHEIVKTFWA